MLKVFGIHFVGFVWLYARLPPPLISEEQLVVGMVNYWRAPFADVLGSCLDIVYYVEMIYTVGKLWIPEHIIMAVRFCVLGFLSKLIKNTLKTFSWKIKATFLKDVFVAVLTTTYFYKDSFFIKHHHKFRLKLVRMVLIFFLQGT